MFIASAPCSDILIELQKGYNSPKCIRYYINVHGYNKVTVIANKNVRNGTSNFFFLIRYNRNWLLYLRNLIKANVRSSG